MYHSRHIRSPSRRIKRVRSASQVNRSKAFRMCCSKWVESSKPHIREQWANFANARETAFNAFLRINIIRAYNDLPILRYPPDVA